MKISGALQIMVLTMGLASGAISFAAPKPCGDFMAKAHAGEIHVRWNTPPPPEFFQNMEPTFLSQITEGALIQVLEPGFRFSTEGLNELTTRGWTKDPFSGQIVESNGPYEKALLNETYKHAHAPEVLQLRMLNRSGAVTVTSDVAVGERGEISPELVMRSLLEVIAKGKSLSDAEDSFLLEVNHVHPGYEVGFLSVGATQWNFIYSPLSGGDLSVLHHLSLLTGSEYFVRMRATLGNGYTYQLTMQNGEILTDPLLQNSVP